MFSEKERVVVALAEIDILQKRLHEKEAENVALRAENATLRAENADSAALRAENARLRKLLKTALLPEENDAEAAHFSVGNAASDLTDDAANVPRCAETEAERPNILHPIAALRRDEAVAGGGNAPLCEGTDGEAAPRSNPFASAQATKDAGFCAQAGDAKCVAKDVTCGDAAAAAPSAPRRRCVSPAQHKDEALVPHSGTGITTLTCGGSTRGVGAVLNAAAGADSVAALQRATASVASGASSGSGPCAAIRWEEGPSASGYGTASVTASGSPRVDGARTFFSLFF